MYHLSPEQKHKKPWWDRDRVELQNRRREKSLTSSREPSCECILHVVSGPGGHGTQQVTSCIHLSQLLKAGALQSGTCLSHLFCLLIRTSGALGSISPQIMAHHHWPTQGSSLILFICLLPVITISQSHFPLSWWVIILMHLVCILLFVHVLIQHEESFCMHRS